MNNQLITQLLITDSIDHWLDTYGEGKVKSAYEPSDPSGLQNLSWFLWHEVTGSISILS